MNGPPGPTGAADRWAAALGEWAIPDRILEQAPENPWSLPPSLFRAGERGLSAEEVSVAAARAALPAGGSVLDVGCGGGAAGLALVPPAGLLVGVDQSEAMLAAFAAAAGEAGVAHRTVAGTWPDAAARVEPADVVVCHHVVYNVAPIVPFVDALTARATRRVVVELTGQHPMSRMSPLWERFWGLRRPTEPSAGLFVEVVAETGRRPEVTRSRRPPHRWEGAAAGERVAFTRRQLCLPVEREPEVAAALGGLADEGAEIVTVWWAGEA